MVETVPLLHVTVLGQLLADLAEGKCCSVVGLSNMGKSLLLRQASSPAVRQRLLPGRLDQAAFFYVDCNLMLTPSEQGFYEVALRSAITELKRLGVSQALRERVQALYQKIIEPPTAFLVPLSFNEAMMALSEELGSRVIFLFDEFDDPFSRLDGRVFLNLRALYDRYSESLSFVTATELELSKLRQNTEASEFCELFDQVTIYVGALEPAEARQLVSAVAKNHGADLHSDEVDFVLKQAGYHLGLIQAVTAVVVRVAAGAPQDLRKRSLMVARQHLDSDGPVRMECAKLWEQLEPEERQALLKFLVSGQLEQGPEAQALLTKGILIPGNPPTILGELFAGYVRRQHRVQQPSRPGVYVDVESGDVWVDGKPVPTLTDHEYRLLLLLYGRINKIVTRDDVAESVWGAGYMEDIDDARCDKLLSRLRSKIEVDPANPKYLQTVRGRGYRLASE